MGSYHGNLANREELLLAKIIDIVFINIFSVNWGEKTININKKGQNGIFWAWNIFILT